MRPERPPASIYELVAALTALGVYRGDNSAAEHAAAAERLGCSEDFYRTLLANALLGVAEAEAGRPLGGGPEDRGAIADRQALLAAGATDSSEALFEFLRWRALRISLPLQRNTDPGTAAVPLAATWAAEGLQLLLGFVADARGLTRETISQTVITADLQAARMALDAALEETDRMLALIAAAE